MINDKMKAVKDVTIVIYVTIVLIVNNVTIVLIVLIVNNITIINPPLTPITPI